MLRVSLLAAAVLTLCGCDLTEKCAKPSPPPGSSAQTFCAKGVDKAIAFTGPAAQDRLAGR